jgi:hypothetical protein
VLLLGDSGISSDECRELADQLGRRVDCADGQQALRQMPGSASLNGQAEQVATERLWPAVALAAAGARPEALPVNFLRPRLAPPRVSRWNRKTVLGIIAAAVVVAGLGLLWWDAQRTETKAVQVEKALEEKKPQITAAEAYIDRVNYARGYFQTRPPALDALRDLSESFGREERIWTTSFSIREDGRGQIQGRAADQRVFLTLLNRLVEDARFRDVTVVDSREAPASSGRGNETVFTLTFRFVPQDAAAKEGAAP